LVIFEIYIAQVSLLFIFGIGIEITRRYGHPGMLDVFDVLANVSGAILGIVVVLLLNLKRGLIKIQFI
jgi:glycopeptide antibiotics resistance protein